MACNAAWRETKPGSIQILARQECARLRRDMLTRMAGAATHAHVLAIERESGLRMIETLGCGIPMQHLEICSVVIGMAFYASRARRSRPWKRSMEQISRCCIGIPQQHLEICSVVIGMEQISR